ncbi:hypothetical protein [Streptomyces sp. NPDC002172]
MPADRLKDLTAADVKVLTPVGPIPAKRDRLLLVAVQHPGEIKGASVENPASGRPDGPGKIVRPAVVAVWCKDGCDIGV